MSDHAQLTLSLFEPITVTPTWDVLYRGADATANGKPTFPHRHLPTRPVTVRNDTVWLAMLDLTEDARRYNQAGRAVLDLTVRNGAGSNGPIGTGDLMLDGKGCENWREKSRATWPALLAGRREQRHAEPEIAAARDLAEAYHYLDYYGHVYAEPDFLGNDQTVSAAGAPTASSPNSPARCLTSAATPLSWNCGRSTCAPGSASPSSTTPTDIQGHGARPRATRREETAWSPPLARQDNLSRSVNRPS